MTQSSVSYTSRLLNYVEPYYIDGVAKSAFYSEVNTNIKRNDKVFILNGYHDSESFISKGKYAKNADGYKVLYNDKCKIVLDIDFKGVTHSYVEDEFDLFTKVYHIKSQREFDYINKIFIDSYTASRYSKFEKGYTNNIIYSDNVYFGIGSGVGVNSGINTSGQFWSRVGTSWVNVTNEFNYNSFTYSNDYYNRGLSANGRIYIVGEDISYGTKTYKQRNIYKSYGTASDWRIDIEYKQPIITKLNFRQGVFKGIHNDGIFGSYLEEGTWLGTESSWNSGFVVNSNWAFGKMNSKSTIADPSYYTILKNGKPIQTTDFSNNKGFGYNYVLDSNVTNGQIINGNFINCNIGVSNNGLTAIDQYFGIGFTSSVISTGGLYDYCDIHAAEITESTTLDSIIDNTYLQNTRTLNSQLTNSYSNGGEFSVNNEISIISADMSSYVKSPTTLSTDIRGVLKLYISDVDYNRLDTFDNFYITKLNKDYILSSLDSDQKILLPYETRYVLDTFWDFKVGGVSQECFTSLKSKFDNKSKIEVVYNTPNYTNLSIDNDNNYASIDIDLGQYLAYYKSSNVYTYINQNIIKKDNVQTLFLSTYITNSDFRDGIIENVKWTSGSNVNYPSNVIKVENNKLKISKVSSNEIAVYLNEPKPTINDNQLRIGSHAWLDSINHIDNNGSSLNLSGVYKISKVEYYPTAGVLSDEARITLMNDIIVNPIPGGGTYSVYGNVPTYVSINKLLIDNSEVNNGLFIRNLFTNTTFTNDEFNNLDKNLTISNVEKLRVVNQVFKDNNNTVKAGLIYKSHILDVNWISGISNNCIWKGASFGGGVFNNGYWKDGYFNNGYFQNSKGLTPSSVDFDINNHYRNWFNGTFNNGTFYNALWLDGTFNNGKMYASNWYGGVWNNGTLGDKNIPTLNTNMGKFPNVGVGATQTHWYNGVVENAQVGGSGIVYWYGGRFNNGVFTSDGSVSSNESIWYDGEFNGGDFTNLSRWKGGTFNKGKFKSHYNWTSSSSTYSTDYSWEGGKFNGGQFGTGDYATNSTWYNGEFNGGIFQGRVWNNGIFQNGEFNGSAITYSVISDEELFTESFLNNYYGLWRNGYVTDIKHKASPTEVLSDHNLRVNQVEPQKNALLKNTLWINGIFDHSSGTLQNSAWLNGSFKKGTFKSSVFNPYVNRSNYNLTTGTYSSFNMNLFGSTACVWENGTFDGGTFYISDWYDGTFKNGTMSGARWINGLWEYGYAKNIYWTDGVWKNGMWDGSPFDYTNLNDTNEMVYNKDRDILLRVSNVLRNGNIHLINAFSGTYSSEILLDTNPTSFTDWTFNPSLDPSANWTAGVGLQLGSGSISNPQLTLISVSYPEYKFQVGSTINTGDVFKLRINFNYTHKSGWVTIIADNTDTPSSISQKLSDKIENGKYINCVETYQYSYGSYITQWVKWSDINGGIYDYPSSTYLSDTVSVFLNLSDSATSEVSSGGIFGGYYTASQTLYAKSAFDVLVFTSSNVDYVVSLNVTSQNGRTDFDVYLGDDSYSETIVDGTKTYNFNYTPLQGYTSSQGFGIRRVMYQNPDNSIFTLNSASVKSINSKYDQKYNNILYGFTAYNTPLTYGPTGPTFSLPSKLTKVIVSDRDAISLKFGNGVFKSGIWENGYWNNGWRSTWDNESDVVNFVDIVNGGVIESSPNTWVIKIQSFNGTAGLNIGDKVSVGNIVCIDVNENRRLITNYYRIVNMDANTITVEVSLNMAVRRIVKDSENHMIYVTKNVWLSGTFHNGYFKGVWNYGLFKGYPYITKMENSQWIDGIFDGGRFYSTQSHYLSQGVTMSYNTGLIQNFTFKDNNTAPSGSFNFSSWIDINYVTYSMTNIFKDNIRYDSDYGVSISDGNLRGYPTFDVLSSDSIFRNSFDSDYKYYKLGSKYKTYVDFIGDGAYFTQPIKTDGAPGPGNFIDMGWTYSNNSTQYHSNTIFGDDNELVVEYKTESYTNVGIKAAQTTTKTFLDSADYISDSDTGWFGTFTKMSYTSTSWPLINVPALSNKVDVYGMNLREYPSGIRSSVSDSNPLGDTDVANRRVYMIDWFNVNSLLTSDGGYNVSGTIPNSYVLHTHASSGINDGTPGNNQAFTFYSYKALSDTTLTINAFVPFTFYATEEYIKRWFGGGSNRLRGGWSIFKFIGVVEKCLAADVSLADTDETKWSYVTNTKLDFYGDTGYWNGGNGYLLDKDSCCIMFDGNPKTLIGKLYINNVNINVNKDDLIRFRLYFVDVRKMFQSLGGDSMAPGLMNFKIGVDPSMGYTENNNGFFEVIDTSTYFNKNTNLLDNLWCRDINKFRYSVIDFDLSSFTGVKYQSDSSNQPTIYLLNDNYPTNYKSGPGGDSVVINHADFMGNRKEYFYNRKSLQMFFKSTTSFSANFGKLAFYETDMIPFFRYTTETNVDKLIKKPLYGVAAFDVTSDSSISLNSSVFLLSFTQSR